MAVLNGGLESAERGSTVWRIVYNNNFQKLGDFIDYNNQAPSLMNNWQAYGSPYSTLTIRNIGPNFINIFGVVKSSETLPSQIATIPSSLCPTVDREFLVSTDSGPGVIEIKSTGEITLLSGGTDKVSIEIMYIK